MNAEDITRLEAYQYAYQSKSTEAKNRYIRELDTNSAARTEIQYLAAVFLDLKLRGCIYCYIEAHIKLLKIQTTEAMTTEYDVYPGTYKLDPVNLEIDWVLTPASLRAKGEEIALRHLANNPDVRKQAAESDPETPEAATEPETPVSKKKRVKK